MGCRRRTWRREPERSVEGEYDFEDDCTVTDVI
jgi:hypothetical protein